MNKLYYDKPTITDYRMYMSSFIYLCNLSVSIFAISKTNFLVKMFTMIYCYLYKNLLDLALLNRFLYFGVLKWQVSAIRF